MCRRLMMEGACLNRFGDGNGLLCATNGSACCTGSGSFASTTGATFGLGPSTFSSTGSALGCTGDGSTFSSIGFTGSLTGWTICTVCCGATRCMTVSGSTRPAEMEPSAPVGRARSDDRLRPFQHGFGLHGFHERDVPLENFFFQDGLDLRSKRERQPNCHSMKSKRNPPRRKKEAVFIRRWHMAF